MNVQIQGGERDGELVPYSGPDLRLPRRVRAPQLVPDTGEPSLVDGGSFVIDRYVLLRGFDGELYYVAENEARHRRGD